MAIHRVVPRITKVKVQSAEKSTHQHTTKKYFVLKLMMALTRDSKLEYMLAIRAANSGHLDIIVYSPKFW